MIRIGQRPLGEVPGLVPAEVRFVQQDAHQLGDRHRRVGVVELDGHLLGKRLPVGVAPPEAAHEIGQRAGDQKILLHESEPLPHARGIVRVQHPGERFGRERLGHRADELAVTEHLEVEGVRRGRRPEAEGVDGLAAEAHHRAIEGDADQAGRLARNGLEGAAAGLEGAVELYFHLLVGPGDLPGVGTPQPVVRLLALPAALDGLPEHAVFIAQAVSHRRELHRGHRVEEAGGEAPQAAVAQAGVRLLFQDGKQVDVLLFDQLPGDGIEQEVRHVVGQRPADEELHRQVIDALGVLALVGLLGAHPALREDVPHGTGHGLEALAVGNGAELDDVVEDQVPLVEGFVGSAELHRATAVLLAELRQAVRPC